MCRKALSAATNKAQCIFSQWPWPCVWIQHTIWKSCDWREDSPITMRSVSWRKTSAAAYPGSCSIMAQVYPFIWAHFPSKCAPASLIHSSYHLELSLVRNMILWLIIHLLMQGGRLCLLRTLTGEHICCTAAEKASAQAAVHLCKWNPNPLACSARYTMSVLSTIYMLQLADTKDLFVCNGSSVCMSYTCVWIYVLFCISV